MTPTLAPTMMVPNPGRFLPDTPQVRAARDAAQKFEAHALGAMLQLMFEGLSARHAFGGGAAEEMWRPMLVSEFGKVIAASGGIGLADAVLRQMLASQEAAQQAGRAELPAVQP